MRRNDPRLKVFTGKRILNGLEEAVYEPLGMLVGIVVGAETEIDTVRVFHVGMRPRSLRSCLEVRH